MNKIILSLAFIFVVQPAFAEFVCDKNIKKYLATYTPNQYTCNAGEFLPANALGCVPCPAGGDCIGGTYKFNPNTSQGLVINTISNDILHGVCAENFLSRLNATYKPNIHTCITGEYLPANIDGCRPCLPDSYCGGGTYSFNETVDQGLTPCPDQHPFAPAGMWTQSQCGRKLHIGDNVLYLHQAPANPTERRLYVQYGDTKYSANLYQISDGENIQKMSVDATRSLRIKINDIDYVVYDDSIK